MPRFRVQRTGKADLVFEGELLASVEHMIEDQEHDDPIRATLYRTKVGRYVLGASYRSDGEPQGRVHRAVSFGTPESLGELIEDGLPGIAPCRRRLADCVAAKAPEFDLSASA